MISRGTTVRLLFHPDMVVTWSIPSGWWFEQVDDDIPNWMEVHQIHEKYEKIMFQPPPTSHFPFPRYGYGPVTVPASPSDCCRCSWYTPPRPGRWRPGRRARRSPGDWQVVACRHGAFRWSVVKGPRLILVIDDIWDINHQRLSMLSLIMVYLLILYL